MTLKNKSVTFLLEVANMGLLSYHLKNLQPNQSKKMEIILFKATHCRDFSQNYYTHSLHTSTISLLYPRILHLPFWQSSIPCNCSYSPKRPHDVTTFFAPSQLPGSCSDHAESHSTCQHTHVRNFQPLSSPSNNVVTPHSSIVFIIFCHTLQRGPCHHLS